MKIYNKILLVLCAVLPTYSLAVEPFVEQDKYDLNCTGGVVCFEQNVKNSKHNFHVEPGSVVRVEVKAKSGASISLISGGNTMSASYLAVGDKVAEKQNVELESTVDKTGNFALEVTVAKVTVNGKPENADGGTYNLKITRIGAVKPVDNIPSESI